MPYYRWNTSFVCTCLSSLCCVPGPSGHTFLSFSESAFCVHTLYTILFLEYVLFVGLNTRRPSCRSFFFFARSRCFVCHAMRTIFVFFMLFVVLNTYRPSYRACHFCSKPLFGMRFRSSSDEPQKRLPRCSSMV